MRPTILLLIAILFGSAGALPGFGATEPNIILGRPTDRSITMSLLSTERIEAIIRYGEITGAYENETDLVHLEADLPLNVLKLLVDNDFTILFHGHDHVFVKQELDGVIYQECPQPSNREAVLPQDENQTRVNGDVAHTYTVNGTSAKADIDGNGYTDLKDALWCLLILAGATPPTEIPAASDVNDDGRIGFPEFFFILQQVLSRYEPTVGLKAFNGTLISGRATADSIPMNVVAAENTSVFIEYGTETGTDERIT